MNQTSLEEKMPIPQGKYVPAIRGGNVIYTSGMTPRQNGVLMMEGKVKAAEPIETYREAAVLATHNALVAIKNLLQPEEKVAQILSMTIYIAAEDGFAQHTQLGDFASEYLQNELGAGGIGSRAVVGVYTLPKNAPLEIQIVALASK